MGVLNEVLCEPGCVGVVVEGCLIRHTTGMTQLKTNFRILFTGELDLLLSQVYIMLQYDVYGATLANDTRFCFGVRPI